MNDLWTQDDFQIGDVVCLTDDVPFEIRQAWYDHPELSKYLVPGERATVVGFHRDMVEVRFMNGTEDTLFPEWLEFVYRPINDPRLYDHSLLDLIEGGVA